jgi:hypothetical protein
LCPRVLTNPCFRQNSQTKKSTAREFSLQNEQLAGKKQQQQIFACEFREIDAREFV